MSDDVAIEELERIYGGEKLEPPVHYANSQWAITNDALVERRGFCFIEVHRLGESGGAAPESDLPEWPFHLLEKTWLDLGEFVEAFVQALRIHEGRYTPLPSDWATRTFPALLKQHQTRQAISTEIECIKQERGIDGSLGLDATTLSSLYLEAFRRVNGASA